MNGDFEEALRILDDTRYKGLRWQSSGDQCSASGFAPTKFSSEYGTFKEAISVDEAIAISNGIKFGFDLAITAASSAITRLRVTGKN
jgi:hypothetical protein